MSKPSIVLLFIAACAIGACAFDEGGLAPPGGKSLHQRLGTRSALILESTSEVGIAAKDQHGNLLPELEPVVRGGSAMLRATDSGLLLVERLEVLLGDVHVPAGVLHSQPVQLTDIELRLGTQLVVEADWGDGTWAAGAGDADLLLDWAVRTEGGDVLPLATQRLRDADFQLYVEMGPDGAITADLTTAAGGHIGNFANRIELSDFTMIITATSPAID